MNEKHGFWYLLSGLVLGLGVGILVAWVLAPVQYVDTTPASLRTDFKDEYRFMIASAFAANNDMLRARARLDTLSDSDAVKALGEQSQRMLANSSAMKDVQILADLSEALQIQPTLTASPTANLTPALLASLTSLPSPTTVVLTKTNTPFASATPVPSITPTITLTSTSTATIELTPTLQPKPISTIAVRPTQTSSPTPGMPFELVKQSTFCETDQPGLLQINLTNANGKPAAGIELIITWSGGEEHFFTGLKPELGYGYADFMMTSNIEYTLSVSAGGARVTGLSPSNCANQQGGTYPGGIHLEFKQP